MPSVKEIHVRDYANGPSNFKNCCSDLLRKHHTMTLQSLISDSTGAAVLQHRQLPAPSCDSTEALLHASVLLTHERYAHFVVNKRDVEYHSSEYEHSCVQIFDGWVVYYRAYY